MLVSEKKVTEACGLNVRTGMLYYHNRIRVNFVSNCTSQLVEKNNRLVSAARNSIICYVTEKWCCMFIHIHKGGEIKPAMWHLESSTSVSVIKFNQWLNFPPSHLPKSSPSNDRWQLPWKAFWEDLTSTSQEHLLWVSHNRNKAARWFLIHGTQCSSSWEHAHWEIILHDFFPAFSFWFWPFLWKYRCRT